MKAHRLIETLKPKGKQELYWLLIQYLVEPPSSHYVSLVVVVPKNRIHVDGIRLCVDYRLMNQISASDPNPISRMDEIRQPNAMQISVKFGPFQRIRSHYFAPRSLDNNRHHYTI